MRDQRAAGFVALVLMLAASAVDGGESPTPPTRTRVRIHAGDTREIPGVIELGPSLIARGQLVRSDDRLVAVKVAGESQAVCLPLPRVVLSGQLLATDHETLTIRFEGEKLPYRVPRYAIEFVDLSAGRKGSRGRNALIGFVTGALVGALIGAATGGDDEMISQGVIVAGSAGALGALGALVGATIPSAEVWQRVPLDQVRAEGRRQQSITPGVSLAISF
jgi:hypothetical protein